MIEIDEETGHIYLTDEDLDEMMMDEQAERDAEWDDMQEYGEW